MPRHAQPTGAASVLPGPRAWLRAAAAAGLAGLLGLLALAAMAQGVLPVPALSGRVIDQTGTLSAAERDALAQQLAGVEAKAGSQIVVLLVARTAPEDIAAYAQRVADSWKIGRRQVGDGLLIVVAVQDRRVRIEVAKALEGAIPDLAARQVIDRQMAPAFRNGDYAGGLRAAVDALAARIGAEGLPAPAAPAATQPPDWDPMTWLEHGAWFFFLAVPVVARVVTAVLGRRLGSLLAAGAAGFVVARLTASLLLGVLAGLGTLVLVGLLGLGGGGGRAAPRSRGHGWPGGWPGTGGGGGGWSSGGGGGGFSSGGGGDFGGGGASGRW